MKYVIFFLAFTVAAHSQEDWQFVKSGVTQNLYDIFFVNKQIGWAVGDDSTIIKTTDGGYNWYRQTGGVSEDYRCLFFLDENKGWIGGMEGLILHTTNGGETWEQQTPSYVTNINDIDFVNDSVGWIASADGSCGMIFCDGSIMKTTNGGKEWVTMLRTPLYLSYHSTARDSLYFGRFHDVEFLNNDTGFVVGEIAHDVSFNLGSVLLTTDGGYTWKHVVPWDLWIATYKVQVVSIDTVYFGYYFGIGRILNRDVSQVEAFEPGLFPYDIAVPDVDHIYALGERGSRMRVLYYPNGATDALHQWLEGPNFRGPNLSDIHYMGLCMIDTTTGWVCGDSGKLWRQPAVINNVTSPKPYIPENLFVSSVYPNPVKDVGESNNITIKFHLKREGIVSLEVFDVLGRRVISEEQGMSYPPGRHLRQISTHGVRKGVYYCKISFAIEASSKIEEHAIAPIVIK